MHIAIIEKGHFEVCYALQQLLNDGQNDITLFIDKPAAVQLQAMLTDTKINWVIQADQENNRSFIRRMFASLINDKFDRCFFSTIADNFDLYASLIRKVPATTQMLMTVHDVNGFFYKPGTWTLRSLVRWIGRRRLNPLIPEFIILSSTLLNSISNKSKGRAVHVIPGSIFEPDKFVAVQLRNNSRIRIVVPGSVDVRRRNYGLVFKLLKTADDQHIPIEITLLGAPAMLHPDIQQQLNAYKSEHDNLIVYNTSVDQQEFDRVLAAAHFIWSPLQPTTTIQDGVSEQYGITTASGNMADIIRHARPYFAPSWLNVEPALKGSGHFYKDLADLISTLRQLTPGKYDQMLQHAYKSSMSFTKEEVLNRNPWLAVHRRH